jgi:hypothetical protein
VANNMAGLLRSGMQIKLKLRSKEQWIVCNRLSKASGTCLAEVKNKFHFPLHTQLTSMNDYMDAQCIASISSGQR